MKKLCILMSLVLVLLSCTAFAETTLEVYADANGFDSSMFIPFFDEFTAETGIKVDLVSPGENYEALLKVRMANNSMPDIWSTHGWAVARYGEYLYPQNEMSYAGDLSELILPIITDNEGVIYTLPMNIDIAGMTVNADVLAQVDVKPEDIVTWADFTAVCAKLKEKGIAAIAIGGKDTWTAGAYFNYVAGCFFGADEEGVYTKQLLDGTFDWNLWAEPTQLYVDWFNNGYINVDCLTADYDTMVRLVAEGKAAFIFHGASAAASVVSKNPDANITMIPWPAKAEGEKQIVYGGEHIAFGAWKDGANLEAAKQLLEYMAKDEVMSKIASQTGMPAGRKSVSSETGYLSSFYESIANNANVRSIPFFDREYLPSGMWDDMCITAEFVLSGDTDAVQKTVDYMRESYEEKMDE